ncbi:MAG: hypothetical protein JNL39_00655 [Opitutaceae bacterium]|nr:hypothetical protein [Opitutaceae bacterium]
MSSARTSAPAVLAGALLAGCQSLDGPGRASAVVFARAEGGGRTYHVQPSDGSRPPVAFGVPAGAGWLQTSPRAGVVALTTGSEAGASAELRVLTPGAGGAGHTLAAEWAWDFSLRAEGDAVAWVAGRERRELFVAQAPAWRPMRMGLGGAGEPAGPRWLSRDRLLVVVREDGRSRLAEVAVAGGEARVFYHAVGRAGLSDVCLVPGTADVVAMETPEGEQPSRVLRLALEGGQPELLVTGFDLPGTLTVSPDGRHIGAVWSDDANTVRRGEAAWRWIGAAWPGAPESVAGVAAAAWGPDGTQLALARRQGARRWIEVHGAGGARPLGFEGAECLAPQWWR